MCAPPGGTGRGAPTIWRAVSTIPVSLAGRNVTEVHLEPIEYSCVLRSYLSARLGRGSCMSTLRKSTCSMGRSRLLESVEEPCRWTVGALLESSSAPQQLIERRSTAPTKDVSST